VGIEAHAQLRFVGRGRGASAFDSATPASGEGVVGAGFA